MNQPSSTHFMLLQATRHWRELTPADQRAAFDDTLEHVFNRYPELRMSHFAAAAGSRCTHVVVWEASEPGPLQDVIGWLRGQAFFGAPLFEVVESIATCAGDSALDDPPTAAPVTLSL